MKKQLLSTAMVLAVLLALTPYAGAASNLSARAVTRTATETIVEFSIDPRFDNISSLASGLTINAWGRASCSGTFNPYSSVDSTITMTLQQNQDGTWVDIKEWSEDSTRASVRVIDKGYYVDRGYRYRVLTLVQIWDTDGTELERVVCDSPVQEH